VLESLGPYVRHLQVELDELDGVRLPPGTQAEWSALWQNLVVNAINAMLDSEEKVLHADHRLRGRTHAITLQDTGSGVDLDDAESLFEPFSRATEISRERRNLGFGGTGLGLTIVRMLAETLNCTVRFVEPSEGFSTAVRVAWTQK
jgi:signal transduction histidine kinase